MRKNEKDFGLDDFEKLKNEIIRDRVNDIFLNYSKDYIAKNDFYYCTKPDGYEAFYALRELFEPETDKRKIIDFLIADEKEAEKENSQPIEF